MAVETQVSEPAMVPKKRREANNKAFKGKKKPKTLMLDCSAQKKPKKIDRKMKKLFRKRARDYNSNNDEDDDERDVGSDGESEKEEEETEDMGVNGDNGVSDDEENGEIQPVITMFLEGSRAFKMAFKSIIKKCVPEDALGSLLSAHKKLIAEKLAEEEAERKVGEKRHVKPANYLDLHEKFLIGVATKGVVKLFNTVNEAQHAQKGLDPLQKVGSRYLDHLIVERKYAEAASLCPKLLRGSASAWERWVFHFAHLHQLPVLVPYMPTDNPRLRDTAYEVALVALASNSSFHKELLSTVKSWPHVIYSALPVILAIEPQLNTSSMTDALKEALAELYVIDGQYEKAFSIYVDLMKPEVFDFIEKHNLQDAIQEKVELYADYDPKVLLPFLRSSQHYTLEKAYETCIRRDLLREQVFILGRMGNSRLALAVIINKLGDIEEAVEFVTMQHDDDLWEELIKQCLNKPEMVGVLLEHTVGNLDPLYIVNMVPNGLEIPRLRDRLVKIITDYRTETSLRHGCNDILKADCVNLLVKYYKEARHGIYLSNEEEEARAKQSDSSASQAIEKSSMRTTEVKSKTRGVEGVACVLIPFLYEMYQSSLSFAVMLIT